MAHEHLHHVLKGVVVVIEHDHTTLGVGHLQALAIEQRLTGRTHRMTSLEATPSLPPDAG
jgi:hypothetical protein